MYSKGMSTRDIQNHIREIYNYDISAEFVSRITESVMEQAREWQSRPLQPVYAIVFMDALFLKLRVDGRVKNEAAFMMIGITLEGQKECLGLKTEIVKRKDKEKWGILAKRWIVERTFAWLNNFRGLSKDYELTTSSAESMIKLAFSKILLNRL